MREDQADRRVEEARSCGRAARACAPCRSCRCPAARTGPSRPCGGGRCRATSTRSGSRRTPRCGARARPGRRRRRRMRSDRAWLALAGQHGDLPGLGVGARRRARGHAQDVLDRSRAGTGRRQEGADRSARGDGVVDGGRGLRAMGSCRRIVPSHARQLLERLVQRAALDRHGGRQVTAVAAGHADTATGMPRSRSAAKTRRSRSARPACGELQAAQAVVFVRVGAGQVEGQRRRLCRHGAPRRWPAPRRAPAR